MHQTACRLPKKPSALIRLAIADLKKAERSKEYEVEMSSWHTAGDRVENYDPSTCKTTAVVTPCYVCLAGSVMAFTLNAPQTRRLEPEIYPDAVKDALFAINAFRVGDIYSGLGSLGASDAKMKKAFAACGIELGNVDIESVEIVEYDEAPAKFKRQMLAMADKLESVGL